MPSTNIVGMDIMGAASLTLSVASTAVSVFAIRYTARAARLEQARRHEECAPVFHLSASMDGVTITLVKARRSSLSEAMLNDSLEWFVPESLPGDLFPHLGFTQRRMAVHGIDKQIGWLVHGWLAGQSQFLSLKPPADWAQVPTHLRITAKDLGGRVPEGWIVIVPIPRPPARAN